MLEPNSSVDAIWTAAFDGTALPNPGRIGLGAVLNAPDGRRFEISRPAQQHGCNNEAELLALCALLELADELGAERLHINGDSDVAVRYVQGQASTQSAHLLPLIARAQQLASQFGCVELHWVPQHRNQEADALARQALGLPERQVERKARSGHKRR
ncbi:MAG: ribonuclease HI family protein [Formivibrio sp.]|nr:ribonuclease HI family protein [Formivibrio sp.]